MTLSKHTNRKGFTLIELLAVLMILGILAALAIPKFTDLRDNAEAATLDGVMSAAVSQCNIEHARLALAGGAVVTAIAADAANNISYDTEKFQAPDFAADAAADTITISVAYNAGQGSATIPPVVWELP